MLRLKMIHMCERLTVHVTLKPIPGAGNAAQLAQCSSSIQKPWVQFSAPHRIRMSKVNLALGSCRQENQSSKVLLYYMWVRRQPEHEAVSKQIKNFKKLLVYPINRLIIVIKNLEKIKYKHLGNIFTLYSSYILLFFKTKNDYLNTSILSTSVKQSKLYGENHFRLALEFQWLQHTSSLQDYDPHFSTVDIPKMLIGTSHHFLSFASLTHLSSFPAHLPV